MLTSTAVEKPNVCRKVALRLLKEALEAAEKGEWDHAHHLAFDATIWLEGASPDN